MKKRIIQVCIVSVICLFQNFGLQAQTTIADTFNVTAGSLVTLLGSQKDLITNLTLSGEINGDDIEIIHYMANLTELNLFGARIVSGGCFNLKESFDSPSGWGVNKFSNDYIQNNEIPSCMFVNLIKLKAVVLPQNTTLIGSFAFGHCTALISITISDRVTKISWGAFQDCIGLTSITIPYSVSSIGYEVFGSAFSGCPALINVDSNNIYFSSKDGVLYNKNFTTLIQCPVSLKQGFIIPSSVKSIGSSAFSGCTGLTTITIPTSVTSIGEGAFSGCTGLTTITIPTSVTSIGSSAFSGCTGLTTITIPTSVTSIGEGAFSGCTGLTFIAIPPTVTSIGMYAFYGCSGLTTFTIPYSVKSIGSYAFYGCTGLTSITIPSSVTSIESVPFYGGSAFSGCPALINVESNNNYFSAKDGVLYNKDFTTLIQCPISLKLGFTILSSVTSIGNYAFHGCTVLTTITIPPSVTSIGDGAFLKCTGLTTIIIPPSVTAIGNEAFSGCIGLITIIIPPSVSSIGYSAFSGCSALINVESNNNYFSAKDGVLYNKDFTTLIQYPVSLKLDFTIPSSVTVIGMSAFTGCTVLTTITIPPSVTSIGDGAFYGCTGLKTINSHITNPTDLYSEFEGVDFTNCKLYIPIGTTSLYKAATSWKNFQNIIEAFVPTGTSFNVDGLIYMINDMNSVGITGKTTYSGIVIPSIVNYLGIDYNITTLGNGSLEYYSNFTDITVPDKVASIGNYTFNSCAKLNKIQLPSGLQSIGDYAFYNCTALSEIRVNAVVPPTLGNFVFYLVDKSKCKLYVPTGSLSTYKSTEQWKDFLNIVEFDATGVENPGSVLFKIYPNPTSKFIHIDLGDNIVSHILKIYNASGQKLYEMRESDNHIQIDVSRYPSGLYFVQSTDQNNRVTNIGRFIMQTQIRRK